MTGNMSGCLLEEYELSQRKAAAGLPEDGAVVPECFKYLLDFLKPFDSFQGNRFHIILEIAVFLIHINQRVPQSLSLGFVVSCRLAQRAVRKAVRNRAEG